MNLFAFWEQTSGTWINAAAVLVGTTLGVVLADRLPARMREIIVQGVGLITIAIGLSMSASMNQGDGGRIAGVVLGLIAVVAGGLLGEWWRLEQRLEGLGDRLKARFAGSGSFTEGFVAASLLFCVGPLTLLGSIENGLNGGTRLLGVKSTLDGIAAVALAGSYGIGVGFSIPVILLYQGAVSLAAGALTRIIPDPANDPRILLMNGVGGILVIGLGINLLNLARIRVAAFLPALALAPLVQALAAAID
ncbi:MAG: DUF554 domain-containing protein [Chloroflexota bacterium]|nr:DUF554 domain-containing protein [Chloroflexota bacterium]